MEPKYLSEEVIVDPNHQGDWIPRVQKGLSGAALQAAHGKNKLPSSGPSSPAPRAPDQPWQQKSGRFRDCRDVGVKKKVLDVFTVNPREHRQNNNPNQFLSKL